MTQASRFTGSIDPAIHHGIIKHGKDLGFSYRDAKMLQESFNKAIITVARERQVRLIDLDTNIPKTNDYMYDIIHFHEKGSEAAAKLIVASLKNSFKD